MEEDKRMIIFIAIDDTDNKESIGTGRLSRMLADELLQIGLASHTSITRHQLLVHPNIPYTSHNSSACIEAIANAAIEEVATVSREFLIKNYHETANPGLCVAEKESVPDGLKQFGYRAQREVIDIGEARAVGKQLELSLWWYGETGQGCIGAMAGVGLRSAGNDGRFIDLAGIRNLKGIMSVGSLLGQSAIHQVVSVSGEMLNDEEVIDTQDWIRPTLHDGQVILFVKRNGNLWIQADGKNKKAEKR
jgi:hypothetical protein